MHLIHNSDTADHTERTLALDMNCGCTLFSDSCCTLADMAAAVAVNADKRGMLEYCCTSNYCGYCYTSAAVAIAAVGSSFVSM